MHITKIAKKLYESEGNTEWDKTSALVKVEWINAAQILREVGALDYNDKNEILKKEELEEKK